MSLPGYRRYNFNLPSHLAQAAFQYPTIIIENSLPLVWYIIPTIHYDYYFYYCIIPHGSPPPVHDPFVPEDWWATYVFWALSEENFDLIFAMPPPNTPEQYSQQEYQSRPANAALSEPDAAPASPLSRLSTPSWNGWNGSPIGSPPPPLIPDSIAGSEVDVPLDGQIEHNEQDDLLSEPDSVVPASSGGDQDVEDNDVDMPPAQSAAAAPDIDWHALEYVDQYDENLDCPICRTPYVRPVALGCDHVFCGDCLSESLLRDLTCPLDRQPIEEFTLPGGGRAHIKAVSPLILNQLDNLRVKCPNSQCGHVCARSRIKSHYESDCAFTKVPCPGFGCGKLVEKRKRNALEGGNCPHEVFKACEFCGQTVDLASIDEHYDTGCDLKEELCSHCCKSIRRCFRANHEANCDSRKIACKFRVTGCRYVAPKKDFGDHETICIYGLYLRERHEHRTEINELKDELRSTREELSKMQADAAAARAAPIMAPGLPIDWQSGLPPAFASLGVLGNKVEDFERHFSELDGRQNHILMNEIGPMKDQLLDLRNTVGTMGMYVRWLMDRERQTSKRTGGNGSGAASLAGSPEDDHHSSNAHRSQNVDGGNAYGESNIGSNRGTQGAPTGRQGTAPFAPSRRLSDRERL